MNAPTERPTPPAGPHDESLVQLDRRRPAARVDLTVNIPTMISIAVLIVTTSATGVGMYYNLDKRQMMTDMAVQSLSQRIDKNEAALMAMKADQAGANVALRGELKSDITEIKGLLNRLIFPSSSSQQRQLREWSKE